MVAVSSSIPSESVVASLLLSSVIGKVTSESESVVAVSFSIPPESVVASLLTPLD